MNVMLSRFVFLAFIGLSGYIVYNALYLQDLRGLAGMSPPARQVAQSGASVELHLREAKPKEPGQQPVRTDLPPLKAEDGASLLVIRAVQRELSLRGFDVGEADGTLSDKTRQAIAAYERSEGLPVTGVATDDLLHHILLGGSAAPDATDSATGDADAKESAETVKAVQRILADLGYAPGAADGALDGATAEAIAAFQRDRNIEATGDVSPDLLRELKRVTGRDLTKTAAKP